jgi:peptidoglycan/LPS O-acetylase OafA/YrhL
VFALVAAVLPRRRGLIEVSALGAAIMIAVELSVTHWFYLYIVWFFPLLMVALLGSDRRPVPTLERVEAPVELIPAPV